MYTAPQRRLLSEYAFKSRFAAPKQNPYVATRMRLGGEQRKNADDEQGTRIGSTGGATVTDKDQRKLMGLSDNPHGTRADKPGKPPSTSRPEGSSEEAGSLASMNNTFRGDPFGKNEGDPLTRGIVADMSTTGGDDADLSPSRGTAPVRVQGPSETPGKKSWEGFGNRGFGNRGFGSRYPTNNF